MQRLRTVTSLDVSAVAGHHAMPAALLLSEHRKSSDCKMSAQSDQKMVFKRTTPHSLVRKNYFCLSFRHVQLDCVSLVLFCEPHDQGQVRNMLAQPDQIIRFRTTIF